jgi:N-methylhydantoinase B/oxoprolinase/acetone carboxylase alpha subunit
MQFSTRNVIERVRAKGLSLDPGDVFIVQRPYLGGST